MQHSVSEDISNMNIAATVAVTIFNFRMFKGLVPVLHGCSPCFCPRWRASLLAFVPFASSRLLRFLYVAASLAVAAAAAAAAADDVVAQRTATC